MVPRSKVTPSVVSVIPWNSPEDRRMSRVCVLPLLSYSVVRFTNCIRMLDARSFVVAGSCGETTLNINGIDSPDVEGAEGKIS
jgi:hypothetical protein